MIQASAQPWAAGKMWGLVKPSTRAAWFGLFLCMTVLAVRLFLCGQTLNGTGDLFRHLYYGWLVWREGLGVAGRPLDELAYTYPVRIWTQFPYNYPVMTLGFFSLVAGIWPSLFACKFLLTLIEAANALMITRLTGERLLGVIYWASPISIWWVSCEGQFEPLQNCFALISLLLLRRHPAWALCVLGLAIQVKLTALALAPWMLVQAVRQDRTKGLQFLGVFCLGFLPTVFANLSYPALKQPLFGSALLDYNPYYWLLSSKPIFAWNPYWMVKFHAFVSNLAFVLLLGGAFRSKDRLSYLAPLLFVIFIKTGTNIQFWYWIVWPTMIVTIREPKLRIALFLLYPLLDETSLLSLFSLHPDREIPQAFWQGYTAFSSIIPLPLPVVSP